MTRWRRFLTWLTRPQFTVITVAVWFAVGNVAASALPAWLGIAICAGLGAAQVLLNRLSRLCSSHVGRQSS